MFSFEKFAYKNRVKLFEFISSLEIDGIALISGDVHYGLMSESPCSAKTGYKIPEITASGMTHTDPDFGMTLGPESLVQL